VLGFEIENVDALRGPGQIRPLRRARVRRYRIRLRVATSCSRMSSTVMTPAVERTRDHDGEVTAALFEFVRNSARTLVSGRPEHRA